MNEKIDKLEQELLNGPDKKDKKSFELPPFVKKIGEYIKTLLKKNKEKKSKDINRKKQFMISLSVFILLLIGCGVLLTVILIDRNTLKKQTNELSLVKNYKVENLKKYGFDEKNLSITTIDDLLKKYNEYTDQNEEIEKYMNSLQAPYQYFLKYIYLPSLNIRKDDFTGELDTSIIGQKYIEKNPYEDTRLRNKWTSFFKYVGKNKEFNTVEPPQIDPITPDENNPELFTIPMTIDFVSDSKRSFLLLVNKISMTSNPENISLIDEFVYYLWKNIKEKKKEVLNDLKENSQYSGWNEDKIIGYNLYKWVKKGQETDLVDELLLSDVVKDEMSCGSENSEICYYEFREKYSSLPALAYTIGIENNPNKKYALYKFFSEINMLTKVEDFTFDRVKKTESLFSNDNIKYKGSVKLVLYGKGITKNEVDEISRELGSKCTQKPLTVDVALAETNAKIKTLGSIERRLDTKVIKQIWELRGILENIQSNQDKLSNYEKVVKAFEMYRMLKNLNICTLRG